MPKIIVQNNKGGVVSIQLPASVDPEAAKRDPSDRTVQLGPVLDIPPGLKMVDRDMWAAAKKNPTVQKMLKTAVPYSAAPEQDQRLVGRMMLVEGREVPDESPLARLKPVEVQRMVDETLDVDTLKEWMGGESRESVRKVIEEQIKKLQEPWVGKGGSLPPPGGGEPTIGGQEL